MIKVFGYPIARFAVLLAGGEACLFFLVILCCVLAPFSGHWLGLGRMSLTLPQAVSLAIFIVLVTSVMMAATGLYHYEVMFDMGAVLARLALSFSMAFAVTAGMAMLLSPWAIGYLPQYKIAVAVFPACALLSFAVRGTFGRLALREDLKQRVLVLGQGRNAAKIGEMESWQRYPFRILGTVDFGEKPDQQVAQPSLSRLLTPAAALDLIETHGIDAVVIADQAQVGLAQRELQQCRRNGVKIEDFSTFWERHAAHVDLDSLQTSFLIGSDSFSINRDHLIAKLCFDYIIALLLLVTTAPITILTAILIKATSAGPIFFRQDRVGRNGKIFQVLKFRSMTQDAEQSGPQWAKAQDVRVTRVGRLIRMLRIDEIPQVINLLKGEMSFVGPRPERPFFVQQLIEQIPYFDERHRVKPGLSGWAQVNYPYGASVEDARHKLSYDLYYLKNGSMFLDLVILLRTVQVVLWPFGAR